MKDWCRYGYRKGLLYVHAIVPLMLFYGLSCATVEVLCQRDLAA